MSELALKVEEKILKRSIRELPEEKTHFYQASPTINCRKDVVGLDYAEVKCTRDYRAQQIRTVVEEGLIQRAMTESEMVERAVDPLLGDATKEGYRRAMREGEALKEVVPYHKTSERKVGEPYGFTDTCVRYLDRYQLQCLKDNVVPAMEPCEKVKALVQCGRDTSFSPAVAAAVVEIPHGEAKKCLIKMQEDGEVFKTEPQPAMPHLAVCAGERQFQFSARPV